MSKLAHSNDETMAIIEANARKREEENNDEPRSPRTTLSDGTQVYPAHRQIEPETGMQKGYVVLADEERAGLRLGRTRVRGSTMSGVYFGISTPRSVTIATAHGVSTPSASDDTSTCATPIVLPTWMARARAISEWPLAGARKLT